MIAVLNATEVPYKPYPQDSIYHYQPKSIFEDNALPIREPKNNSVNSILIFDLIVLMFLIAMLSHAMGQQRLISSL